MNNLNGKVSLMYRLRKKIWKSRNLEERRMLLLRALIPSSILFFLSIFTGSYKILGLGSLQFVLIVFLNVAYMCLSNNIKVVDLIEVTRTESESLYEKGSFASGLIYSIVIPAVVGGIIMILIIIIMLFLI